MKVKKLSFADFTLFGNLELEFSPNINVITGTNGVGKTIVMKTLYSILKTVENINNENSNPLGGRVTADKVKEMLASKFVGVFRPDDGRIGRLVRRKRGRGSAEIKVLFDNDISTKLNFTTLMEKNINIENDIRQLDSSLQAIFIPPKEIISASDNFFSIYENYHISFEETYYDLNKLLLKPLKKGPNSAEQDRILEKFERIIDGKVVLKENKFFIKTQGIGEIEMGLSAEGYRKLATILYLVSNGTISQNSILFWDEPEANLNPKMIKPVTDAIIEMAKMGVQIFLTTHSYFLLQELSMFSQYSNNDNMGIKFLSLYPGEESNPIEVESVQYAFELEHNAILEEFESLYNREQENFYDN